jgi:hypothetical protein
MKALFLSCHRPFQTYEEKFDFYFSVSDGGIAQIIMNELAEVMDPAAISAK